MNRRRNHEPESSSVRTRSHTDMKAFAVVAVLLVAYANADVTELTSAQLDALSAEETKAITDEQWGVIFNRMCNPAFASYAKSQYLPDRRNCHYFFECVGFEAVRKECAANLYWNARLNTCDYPYRAGCYYSQYQPSHNQPSHNQPINNLPINNLPNNNLPINNQPINNLPINNQPQQHLPLQPAYPIQGNNNGAISIPINNPVVDPYKQ